MKTIFQNSAISALACLMPLAGIAEMPLSSKVRTTRQPPLLDANHNPVSVPFPARSMLDFTVEGFSATTPLSSAEARARLIPRINALYNLVMRQVFDGSNKPRPTAEILKRLHKASDALPESSTLHKDLHNLLISALARTTITAPEKAKFEVWSYRKLEEEDSRGLKKGEADDPLDAPLCGPTITAHPDSLLLIPVLNLLDREHDLAADKFGPVPASVPLADADHPGGFDIVNLHTHGLNVSPSWPADDIFREVHPWQLKFYVYYLPADHPVGTFWYHPHQHGSVATQVAGGMAGALLVTHAGKWKSGDKVRSLDDLALEKKWADNDAPLLLQQLKLYRETKGGVPVESPSLYVSRPEVFAMKDIVTKSIQDALMPNGTGDPERVFATIHQTSGGVIDSTLGILAQSIYTRLREADPDPEVRFRIGLDQCWLSGRYLHSLSPRKTGETIRLRLIHAGIEEPWDFRVRAVSYDVANKKWVDVDTDPNSKARPRVQVIAWDGVPVSEPYEISNRPDDDTTQATRMVLAPGNRAEVLVWFPPEAVGRFAIVNRQAPVNDSGSGQPLPLAYINVSSGANGAFQLLSARDMASIVPPSPGVARGGKSYSIQFKDATVQGNGQLVPGVFTINGSTFPGTPYVFDLDSTVRMNFDVNNGTHPFHMHVNPLYIAAADSTSDRRIRGLPTCAYWTDTLLVDGADNGVMQFLHFTGRSVVHCHILDHEDNGMMNIFEIRHPGGFPVSPLPGVLDMPVIPKGTADKMVPVWPAGLHTLPPAHNGAATVIAFLPQMNRPCLHCAAAIKSLAALRDANTGKDKLPFRIIAVLGPAQPDPDGTAAALKLSKGDGDVLCFDPNLEVFQAVGLIDGNPIYESATKTYIFPDSFDGKAIKQPGDVMHGLFVMSPSGFIVSANRGFTAYDNTDQTMAEIKLAVDLKTGLAAEEAKIKQLPATPQGERRREWRQLNLDRFQRQMKEASP